MAVSLELARARVLAACRPLPSEVVPVADALGRVLAAQVIARTDVPPFANSAMDGFAVTAGPPGRTLRLVGESLAGAPTQARVDRATAIRVSTGAALPPGADAVVADERASLTDGLVELHVEARPGLNVRFPGEDIPAGRPVLEPGLRLGPVELAVAIGAGYGELVCHRRPRLALLGTGNELRDPGSHLRPGEIYDSNTTTLAALAHQSGALVVSRDRLPDDPRATRRALADAFDHADLVILTGGVSVGPLDHVRAALAALGTDAHFSGLAVRPGRPAWFGTRSGLPVFALPGNPVAAIVIFILLARPALHSLTGTPDPPSPDRARLTSPVSPTPGRTNILAARLRPGPDGVLEAGPSGPLRAHATSALLGRDALVLVPPGPHPLDTGTMVDVLPIST